jgi:hypothetical protein
MLTKKDYFQKIVKIKVNKLKNILIWLSLAKSLKNKKRT